MYTYYDLNTSIKWQKLGPSNLHVHITLVIQLEVEWMLIWRIGVLSQRGETAHYETVVSTLSQDPITLLESLYSSITINRSFSNKLKNTLINSIAIDMSMCSCLSRFLLILFRFSQNKSNFAKSTNYLA